MDLVKAALAALGLACRLGLAVAALSLPRGAEAAQSQALEQAVKASFLFKFAPFVEWPSGTFEQQTRTFNLCLSGSDPFGNALNEVVRGQRIYGHPVVVRRLAAEDNAAGCHVLFAGKGTSETLFGSLSGRPVLTVGDSQNGASGTMIQFVMQSGRVRFRIDEALARNNGLSISSKLLGLAVSVERK